MSSPKPKSRMSELEILTHSKFWFVFPVLDPWGTSLQTSRLFTAPTKDEHLKQQTAKTKKNQTNTTKNNKTKQPQNSLRNVSSHCSCR